MKFELDNFQKQAIKSLLDGLNVLVTAPTGSGKTLIAEKGIEKYIEDGKKVIYTTPIKALSNQKFNDFQNEGIDTGLLTGDRNENPNANLIIATTEILRNMIFSEDERINEIGLVILDEVHYLADKERGATWEEIIIHLPKKIKILGLSATIGNENEFLSWIVSQRGPTDLIKSNIRPVPLEISLVTATQNDDQITTIKSTKDKKNKRIFQFDKKYRKFKKPTLSNQLEFISLKNSTPSIFFFFSRDKVESKARHASNLIGKTTDNHDLKVLFDSVFGDLTIEEFNLLNLDELFWMWSRRIGFHHAGLAPIVKEFVEHLFINRYIDILFATETLSLGINMPAKSIMIDSSFKYDGIRTRLISKSEFLQLTGRAGRRGIDNKGIAFINYDRRINFRAKISVLNDLGYFTESKKNKLLTETYRDSFLIGIELLDKLDDIEFCLMFLSSGISNQKYEIPIHKKQSKLLSKFLITQETVNILESKHNVKNKTKLDVSWFSIFSEYIKSNNIEYTISKFNITLGDFIKASREAAEISQKVSLIYGNENFDFISDKFRNNIIQKSML